MIKIKYIVISLMILAFLCLLVTGLMKFPGFFDFFGINHINVANYWLNFVHDWSGLALLVLIAVHLILNRKWLGSFFDHRIGPVKIWHLAIGLAAVLSVILIFLINSHYSIGTNIRQLASTEIKEYQGENLSSIVDLGETSISGIQYIDQKTYNLEITGLVNNPKKYTYEEVLSFDKYSKVVTLNCVVGWSAKILWEGVLLKDLLKEAGVRPEAKILIFYAQDGFTTSLPLDYVIDNNIILADKVNGIVLPPEKGFPFQLVAEQKWGYKWVKWLTKIELSDNINYRGTYEKAGYNNDGSLNKPKMGL